MTSRFRPRLALAVAVCLALAVAFGATIASGDPSNSGSPGAAPLASEQPTVAVRAVQPDAAAAFKLLRDIPPTPMPAEVAEMVGSPKRFGRNPDLARQITTATGPGWVIPGDGYICIAVKDPVDGYGSTCSTTKDAVRLGLAIGLHDASGKGIDTMLVPDGARAVRLVGHSARPLAATAKHHPVRANRIGVVTAHTGAPASLRVVY